MKNSKPFHHQTSLTAVLVCCLFAVVAAVSNIWNNRSVILSAADASDSNQRALTLQPPEEQSVAKQEGNSSASNASLKVFDEKQKQPQQQKSRNIPPSSPSSSPSSASPSSASSMFVNPFSLRDQDTFSATWWQSTERFVKFWDPKRIQNVEGAAFAFTRAYKRSVMMTSDWLQFSVEHLSKAWKQTGFDRTKETAAYHLFVDRLLNYTNHALEHTNVTTPTAGKESSANPMTQTIALIAFMPYTSQYNATRGQVLTAASLAAAAASLIRVQCGRIVIVLEVQDALSSDTKSILHSVQCLLQRKVDLQRESLERLFQSQSVLAESQQEAGISFQVQNTEIAVATVHCRGEDETKRKTMRMIPKAALLNLHRALLQTSKTNTINDTNSTHASQWLGQTRKSWKYAYLTEPDTILLAKPEALVDLGRTMDVGNIVVPHRLQPIPHGSDLPNYFPHNARVLPAEGNFSQVLNLCTANDRCCDDGRHVGFAPSADCRNKPWWRCGFGSEKDHNKDHWRLAEFQLIRLVDGGGTGIVSVAGSNHGRRCKPRQAHEGACPTTVGVSQIKRARRQQPARANVKDRAAT